MEIIPFMVITVTILLSSFPVPIKAAPGGGGMSGGGRSYVGGMPGGGYLGGSTPGKPIDPVIDPGVVITPKPSPIGKLFPDPPKVMPKECKMEVRDCINKHIYGSIGVPKYRGPCCTNLKNAVQCVCKFLNSQDPILTKRANEVLRGCHYIKPICRVVPMPQECAPEVRHCVDVHIYGGAGKPKYQGACCKKFKNAKKCVCKFLDSRDSHLDKQAHGVVRGCNFNYPKCPGT